MIQKKIPSFTTEKKTSDQVYTCWSLVNEEKKENLKNEFLNRIEALDKKGSIENILEKTTRFCHNETQKEYLPKIYDPFLHGISRGRIKKLSPFQIITKTYKKKNIRGSWINKIHAILLKINSQKFEQTIEKFKRKSLSIEKKLYFFSEPQEEKIQSEEEIKIFKILFDVVIIYNNDQTLIKNFIDFHEINKQVPQWSYKLTSELEELEAETEENIPTEPGIRSRKAKRVVVFTDLKEPHNEIYTNLKDNQNSDQTDEMALIRYSQQSDFRREIIKGSMRSQRLWGLETDLPFGSTKPKPSFFKPIFKELKKRIKKSKTKSFPVLRIFKERATIFLKVEKEIKNWIIKNLLFLKEKKKNLSKRNRIPLVGPREIYELNETKKDSIMSNQMIHELSVQKKSTEWPNSSLSENKIKNVIDKIKTIRNQTKKISKEKEKLTNSCNKLCYDSKIIESSKKIMTYALYHKHMYFTNYHKFKLNQIKDFFKEQGIFHYEWKDKTLLNSEINQWKNWLRSHSQYNLPQIAWARLVTQKWKKKLNQDSLVLNPSLNKVDSYEKKIFDNYKKQNFCEANLFFNPKHKQNFKKDSIYNLFCYKSIHSTEKFFDMSTGLENFLISCFLEKYNIRSIGEILHRKYLDWRILNFWFRKKVNIELDTRKFFLFSSTYKMKPWVIPIKSLLFNFNETKNVNKQITLKKKGFIPSNEKNSFEENESAGQEEFESDKETKKIRNQLYQSKKKILKNYTESKIKKRKNKKNQKAIPKRNLTYFQKFKFRFGIAF
ncbi:hypothetical protein HID58_091359, partial [Brassica napus]